MRPVRGVSLHKYSNSYDKVVNSGPNILTRKYISITIAPFHNFGMLSIEVLAILTNKGLLGLRTLMVKTVQIRRCKGFQKLGDM